MKVEGKYKEIKKKRWEVPIDIIFSKIDIKKMRKERSEQRLYKRNKKLEKLRDKMNYLNDIWKKYTNLNQE